MWVVVFWLPALEQGLARGHGETLEIDVPTWTFIRRWIQAEEFPLWNPRAALGTPLISAPWGLFYLPALTAFSFWSIEAIHSRWIVAHVLLGAAGIYTFVRLGGGRPLAATLGAVVYTATGTVVVAAAAVGFIMPVAWTPWIFVCVEWILKGRHPSALSGAALAAACAAALLGGQFDITYLIFLASALFAFFRLVPVLVRRRWPARQVATLAGATVAGMLLAAVLIVPFFEFFQQSDRLKITYEPGFPRYA